MRTRRTATCIISILVVCLSLFAVPIIAYASAPVEQEEVWEDAAGFDELMEKFEAMKTTGGNIRLTGDVVVEAGVDYTFSAPQLMDAPIRLDTGGHSIIVHGKLIFMPFIEIAGAGGDAGIFSVQDGGWLELYSISVKADSDVAIAQAPRSVLCYGTLFDGAPEFVYEGEIKGAGPVAVPWSNTNPKSLQCVYVRDDERAEDLLPDTDEGALYQNGRMDQNHQLDVAWDIDLFKTQFEARENCMVTGNYPGATEYATPVCMVAFQNGRAATVLNGWGTGGTDGRGLSAQIQLALENPQESCRVDWSADGENWQECEANILETKVDRLRYALYPPDDAGYPFYISAVVTKNGEEHYSNILVLRAPGKAGDIGGNRGGGTSLVDPEKPIESEPPENVEAPAGPTLNPPENSAPTTGQGVSPIAPPATNTEAAHGGTNESALEGNSDKASRNGTNQTNLSPIAATKNDQTPSGSMENSSDSVSDMSLKKENSVLTEIAAEAQRPQSEYSESAAFQTAMGAIISGGVIVLAVTWNSSAGWGKKLLGRIKRLTHK